MLSCGVVQAGGELRGVTEIGHRCHAAVQGPGGDGGIAHVPRGELVWRGRPGRGHQGDLHEKRRKQQALVLSVNGCSQQHLNLVLSLCPVFPPGDVFHTDSQQAGSQDKGLGGQSARPVPGNLPLTSKATQRACAPGPWAGQLPSPSTAAGTGAPDKSECL